MRETPFHFKARGGGFSTVKQRRGFNERLDRKAVISLRFSCSVFMY